MSVDRAKGLLRGLLYSPIAENPIGADSITLSFEKISSSERPWWAFTSLKQIIKGYKKVELSSPDTLLTLLKNQKRIEEHEAVKLLEVFPDMDSISTAILLSSFKNEQISFVNGVLSRLGVEKRAAVLSELSKINVSLVNELLKLFPSFKTDQLILGLFEMALQRLKLNQSSFIKENLAAVHELFELYPEIGTEQRTLEFVEVLGKLLSDTKDRKLIGSDMHTESQGNWRMDWGTTTHTDEYLYITRRRAKETLLEIERSTDSEKIKDRIKKLLETAPPDTDTESRTDGWHEGNV